MDNNPEEKEVKLIMAQAAWAWYNNILSLGGTRPRNWLSISELAKIADAIEKPISLEELQYMVQKDGPVVQCSCGKEFQPVKVIFVTGWFLSQLRSGISILSMDISLDVGSFVVRRNEKGEMIKQAHCGPLFFYNPKVMAKDGHEAFCANMKSCIGRAYRSKENRDQMGHPYRTRSSESASAIVKVEDDIRKERQKVEEKLEQKKPVKKPYRRRDLVPIGKIFEEALAASAD